MEYVEPVWEVTEEGVDNLEYSEEVEVIKKVEDVWASPQLMHP